METSPVYERRTNVAFAAMLSVVLVSITFLLQGNIGFELADEGFLWHGSVLTFNGLVPVRDFQAYDPGRYFWIAAWFRFLGDGILDLRLATSIFQAIGLFFGVLVLQKTYRSYWIIAAAAIILLVWMYPRHKLFEPSILMAAVFCATMLVEDPSLFRHFICGVFVGIAAFFGRNLGLYCFLAFLLLIVFIYWKIRGRKLPCRLGLWSAGVVVGYLPVISMLLFVPGFFDGFWDSIVWITKVGGTNLALPVPWPWRVDFSDASTFASARSFIVGLFFLLMPLFYTGMGIFLLLTTTRENIKERAVCIAAVAVGLMCMHHPFSRADLRHLAQGIHPLLLGLFSLALLEKGKHVKTTGILLVTALLIASVLTVGTVSPFYKKMRNSGDYTRARIGEDEVWVDGRTARLIDCVETINRDRIQPDERLLIAPHWPGCYPLLERESPLWTSFFLFKEPGENQEEMVAVLRENEVEWVILGDVALDGRESLRFRYTHDLVYEYIHDTYRPVEVDCLPKNYLLLRRIQEQ